MSRPKIDRRFDRLCAHLLSARRALTFRQPVPWETDGKRGRLDLSRDGAQHRKFHAHHEDLLN